MPSIDLHGHHAYIESVPAYLCVRNLRRPEVWGPLELEFTGSCEAPEVCGRN